MWLREEGRSQCKSEPGLKNMFLALLNTTTMTKCGQYPFNSKGKEEEKEVGGEGAQRLAQD